MPDVSETDITLYFKDEKKSPQRARLDDLTKAQEWTWRTGEFPVRVTHIKNSGLGERAHTHTRVMLPIDIAVRKPGEILAESDKGKPYIRLDDTGLVEVNDTGGDGQNRLFVDDGGSFEINMSSTSPFAKMVIGRRVFK